jgi:DegV family protein with EDD domain
VVAAAHPVDVAATPTGSGGSYPASFVSDNHVRIVTDSACDLPQSVADELAIEIVPLTIRIDGKEYVDRRDLSVAEFWAKCAASPTLPETAAPSPGQFEERFRKLAAEGASSIVTISLSGALSATMQSAELAARSVADTIKVTVVDSRSVTVGLGAIVVACARLAAQGAAHDDIIALAHDLADRTRVWGALDTLDNLKKGGRIGGAKALLASALAIKPIVEVRDGKVEQGGKQRTRAKALAFLVDKVAEMKSLDEVYVLHADCRDVDQFIEMLRPHVEGRITVGDIGPVVGSHTGRGTIGVAFFATR